MQADALAARLAEPSNDTTAVERQPMEQETAEAKSASLQATKESEAAWAAANKLNAQRRRHNAAADTALRKARRLEQLGKRTGEAQRLVDSTGQLAFEQERALCAEQEQQARVQELQQVWPTLAKFYALSLICHIALNEGQVWLVSYRSHALQHLHLRMFHPHERLARHATCMYKLLQSEVDLAWNNLQTGHGSHA